VPLHSAVLEGGELQPARTRFAESSRAAHGPRHGARRMKRATALRRELPAAFRIPYRAHVSPYVVRTDAGDYVQVFKLDGASFETADDEVLNNWHERLNVLWRGIAAPNVALWTHIVRRRERVESASAESDDDFAGRLARRYRERLSSETLM